MYCRFVRSMRDFGAYLNVSQWLYWCESVLHASVSSAHDDNPSNTQHKPPDAVLQNVQQQDGYFACWFLIFSAKRVIII